MTTVSAVMRRSYTADMFADLGLPPHARTYDKPVTTLTFDGVLTAAEQEAVWARMESADDADQGRRANLRADRDAVLTAADPTTLDEALAMIALLRTAVVDGLNYVLGDTGL